MKTTAFLVFILSVLTSVAQNGNSVSGTIKDQSGTPLEFINVILYTSSDSTLVKATASEQDGKFSMENLPDGKFFVRTSFIGYADNQSETFDLSGSTDHPLGSISLVPASTETETVEVVYKKPLVQVEADKTVFNVEGTINSAGLNALELLRKAPGVMLDNNDNISVKGRSGIIIYIDGKRTPLDGDGLKAMLKSMQSSNIESIEIITNPSAKYDAAGTAGIINIKLKKNKNFGTNGSVQLGYGVQLYSKYNGSINLNHRNEKWNFYGMYGGNTGKYWSWMDFTRSQLNPSDSLIYVYKQQTDHFSNNTGHNYKGGIDHYLNSKNTIGLMVSGNIADDSYRGESYTDISQENEEVQSTLEAFTKNESTRNNINGNVNYHFSDTTGKDLNIDADYGMYTIRTKTYQPNTYRYPGQDIPENSINYRFITPVDISIMSLKGDYEQPLLGGKMGAGFKMSYVQTENTLNRYNVLETEEVLDSILSNSFKYDEHINAGYVNYKRQFTRIGMQAGVRAEQTKSSGKLSSFTSLSDEGNRNVNRNYLNFFPSGGITYNVNDTNQFSLTYSRRIDRPSYQDLNPFEFKLDELSYMRGNPFLQPQYGNIAELTYTYMYSLNASLTYSYTQDFFTDVTDTANYNASYIMKKNLGYEEWAGLNISSPIPIGKRVNAFVNFNTGRKHIKADFNSIDLVIWSYSAFAQATFSFPRSYTAEVSGWYSGPSVWGATLVTRPMGSMDVAVKKELFDGKASLRVALGDVLYTNIWHSSSTIPQVQIRGAGGWESRQVRVSFSYNFGNQQMKGRQRKTGADDLKERVK